MSDDSVEKGVKYLKSRFSFLSHYYLFFLIFLYIILVATATVIAAVIPSLPISAVAPLRSLGREDDNIISKFSRGPELYPSFYKPLPGGNCQDLLQPLPNDQPLPLLLYACSSLEILL